MTSNSSSSSKNVLECSRLLVNLLMSIALISACKVYGQSTAAFSSDRRISGLLSQTSCAAGDIICRQLQDITSMYLHSIKKNDVTETIGKIAAQQQELVQYSRQIRQDLATVIQRISSEDSSTAAVLPDSARGSKPRDCSDIMSAGYNTSGIFTVFIGRTDKDIRPVSVYCDMETAGGGWTVFQRRKDGTENFYRTWNQYLNGFGSLNGEFWLGNENLYAITRDKRYKLRFDLADFEGNSRFAEYSDFRIGSECDKFKLVSVGTYSGDAGDSLTRHVGSKFSAHDEDNDSHSSQHCSVLYKGGWWYDACHLSNLNGHYYGGSHASYADGVNWRTWKEYHYSLRFTEMKIKPAV